LNQCRLHKTKKHTVTGTVFKPESQVQVPSPAGPPEEEEEEEMEEEEFIRIHLIL